MRPPRFLVAAPVPVDEAAREYWPERDTLAARGQDEVEDGLTVHSGTLGGERNP